MPAVVTPIRGKLPPSEATILFEGQELNTWRTSIFGYGVNMEQISSRAQAMHKIDYESRKVAPWEIKSE